jgi:hypothetical protein
MITKEVIVEELGNLIREERVLEKLLERASRSPEDPREVAFLWNLATECRDHARILSRHRKTLERGVTDIPYPRWPRGQGPQPEEALQLAKDLAVTLAGNYRSSESLADDPYLRKFLMILAEEHDRRAIEIRGIADGFGIFEEIEEPDVQAELETESGSLASH